MSPLSPASVRQRLNSALDMVMEATVAPSFSRIGYEVRSRIHNWHPVTDDMRGQVVLITGASSGLGRATAEALAALGADLILVGRDEARLASVSSLCRNYAPEGTSVTTVIADLTRLSEARDLVVQVEALTDRLDVLVHNAGALVHEYRRTEDGFEQTYAAQVLSQHVITAGLLPLLAHSPKPRVIVVSSGGMYTQRLNPESMEMSEAGFDGVRAYALAKRAQVALNEEWARRFPHIFFATMHPGWADTPGVAESLPTFKRITGPFLRSPQQGADTIVWLAADQHEVKPSGHFWLDRAPRAEEKLPGTAGDDEDAARLWDLVCQATGVTPAAR